MKKTCPMQIIVKATVCLAVLLVGATLPAQTQTKGNAYIWVGDISPGDLSLALRSPFGTVDPYKELKPLIEAQKKKMEDMGYKVKVVDNVVADEIEKAICDPQTKAIAFFGHGDESIGATFGTLQGDDVVPNDIQGWAQKQLAGKIGEPKAWKGLDKVEQQRRKALWDNAHFDMKYVYMHSCYSLTNNKMAEVLMADDGEFRGYVGKSYLTDTSTPGKSNLARLQDEMNGLKEKHRTLKAQLDTSGGYDETVSKEMTGVYREFLRLRALVETLKAYPK
jgi:hypothetical protein